jgi:hypothetical protein
VQKAATPVAAFSFLCVFISSYRRKSCTAGTITPSARPKEKIQPRRHEAGRKKNHAGFSS